MRRPGVLSAVTSSLVLLSGCAGEPNPDADWVPSPTPPVAPADYAELVHATPEESLTEYGLQATTPSEAGLATGPGFALAVLEIAVAGEFSSAQDSPLLSEPLLAGPGREFLVAWIGKPDDVPPPDGIIQVSAAVEAEDQRSVPLGEFTYGAVIVASVPTSGDAVLELSRDGEGSELSLRTGRNVSGADAPADQLATERVELTDYFRLDGVTNPDVREVATCEVRVDPTSHVRPEGSPEDGNMWLDIDVTLAIATIYSSWDATVVVDLAESLVIVADGGDPLPVPGQLVELETRNPTDVEGESSIHLEVPDTVRTLEVTFTLQATFTADDGSGTLSYQRSNQGENTGTLTLTPLG